MFDNLGDDFPFDWLVKCFQKKKKILWIYLIAIQEIVYFLPYFIYVYLANSYLKCYGIKIGIKRSCMNF